MPNGNPIRTSQDEEMMKKKSNKQTEHELHVLCF